MIRLGVCTGIENAEIVKNAGFDYIELNCANEAQMLAGRVNHPAVAALADMYHMAEGGDFMEGLDHGMGVIHTHIACPGTRAWPKAGDAGLAMYTEFFERLKKAGYDGRVSIEGGTEDIEKDAPEAFKLLDALR